MHYADIEARRKRFERRYARLIRAAMAMQLEQSLSLIALGEQSVEVVQEEPVRNALSELYKEVGVYFAEYTYNALLKSYSQKKVTPRLGWESNILLTILSQIGNRISSITQTVKDKIRTSLSESFEKGLSVEDTQKQIRKEFSRYSRHHALLIARTELVSASNMGSILGAKSTGLNLLKGWLATRDQRTRPDHLMANNQYVPMTGFFNVGGELMQYPGDPSASAANTVMCRCAIVYKKAG